MKKLIAIFIVGLAMLTSAQAQNPGVRQQGNIVVGNCAKWFGFNVIGDSGGTCGGGTGSPGGASGTIQWNNAGSFDGITGWTTNGATSLIGGAGTTITIGAGAAITSSGAGGALGALAFLTPGTGVATALGNTAGGAGGFALVGTTPPTGAAGGDLSGSYPNPAVAKVNGIAFSATAAAHTVPVTTTANTTSTYKVMPDCTDTGGNHINFTQSTDAFSCGTSTASSGIVIGTTTITSGTTTRILYDNAGVVGEYTLTGTGTVAVMQNTPTLTTPVLGVATGTSVALSGCTIGANVFCLTGSAAVSADVNVSRVLYGTVPDPNGGKLDAFGLTLLGGYPVSWRSGGNGTGIDTHITRASSGFISLDNGSTSITFGATAANTLQFVGANSATPGDQSVQGQGSRSGTDNNVSGGALNLSAGIGTGNSTGALLRLQSPVPTTSGTGAQTLLMGAYIKNGLFATNGNTLALLPGPAVLGARMFIVDQLTACPATGVALTGGGAVVCPAFYNGTAWVGG